VPGRGTPSPAAATGPALMNCRDSDDRAARVNAAGVWAPAWLLEGGWATQTQTRAFLPVPLVSSAVCLGSQAAAGQRRSSSRTWRLAINESFGRWTDERITQLMQLQ
jgi:hypothetical protein